MDLLPAELRDAKPADPAPAAPRRGDFGAAEPVGPAASRTLRSNVSELEKQMIAGALARHRGNKARVARELGVSYPTLLNRIRAYRLEEQAG